MLSGGLSGPGLLAAEAETGGACDRRDAVLGLLADRYSEAPIALGVTSGGSLIELLTDARGDTWSIVVTSPEGESCLVLSGQGWRRIQQAKEEPEA